MPALTQIQMRRGAAAAWTAANPVLTAGEHGVESDTGNFKIGDGATDWNTLLYAQAGLRYGATEALRCIATGDARLENLRALRFATDATVTPLISIQGCTALFSGTDDPSVQIGYNHATGHAWSKIDPAKVLWTLGLEGDYNDGAGHRYSELNLNFQSTSGLVLRRPFNFAVDSVTDRIETNFSAYTLTLCDNVNSIAITLDATGGVAAYKMRCHPAVNIGWDDPVGGAFDTALIRIDHATVGITDGAGTSGVLSTHRVILDGSTLNRFAVYAGLSEPYIGYNLTDNGGFWEHINADVMQGLVLAKAGVKTYCEPSNAAGTRPAARLTVTATGAVFGGNFRWGQAAGSEIISLSVTADGGREWGTGAIALQRESLFAQPIYRFVGASVVTDAATVAIAGAPKSNDNSTITTSHGLLIQSADTTGAGACTASYGLTVNAMSGATANYAAQFMGGKVGIGTATPGYRLSVHDAGASKTNTDVLGLTNLYNAADMDGTATSLLFRQYYYDAATPAAVDAGRITVGTETDWTSTASTQDSYMSFSTALDGVVIERMRVSSGGELSIYKSGTIRALTDALTLSNPACLSTGLGGMIDTRTGLRFRQGYDPDGTLVDSARITVGTETDWTSTASTQDAYMAFGVALNGTVTTYMTLASTGLLTLNPGTTPATALLLDMAAPATHVTVDSHWLQWRGRSHDDYDVDSNDDWIAFNHVHAAPGAGSDNLSYWTLQQRINAVGFATKLEVGSDGSLEIQGGFGAFGVTPPPTQPAYPTDLDAVKAILLGAGLCQAPV
jgi:hypothetical protein